METQKTILNQIQLKGTGLHTGKPVNLTIKPAAPNTGIVFKRLDLPGEPHVSADISNISEPAKKLRRSALIKNGVEVHTIEHMLSACFGLGIDNLEVLLDSEELPGFDGSAKEYVEAFEKAGISEQDVPRNYFQVREPVWVEEEGSTLILLPSTNGLTISYTLNYDHPLLKAQYISLNLEPEIFKKEIAPARTFCMKEEADALRAQGLGKGADYKNTLVVGDKGVIDNKLRFEDEFVRHKVSDLIGDLSLFGIGIKGHVVALRSGHSLNIKLIQRLRLQQEKIKQTSIPSASVGVPEGTTYFDSVQVQQVLPHRYPFLLVDRIIELEVDKRAVGIKNVTINDNFFPGHFPGRPVMPGVLIVEALAQVAGVLMLHKKENKGKLAFFMSIDKVKFRKTVTPGDQLRLEVDVIRLKSKTGQVSGKAIVDGNVVAEADLMFSLVDG